jgi:hypothetical protein
MKPKKIYKKTEMPSGEYALKCPVCGYIIATATKKKELQDGAWCNNINCENYKSS